MGYREKQRESSNKITADYEDNLKLHYEAVRKELDILIGSTMPHQFNVIKTLLWLNIVFIGISIKIMEDGASLWFTVPFFIVSAGSIFSSLIGMRSGRYVHYGVPGKVSFMSKTPDGRWAKSNGLVSMLYEAQRAVRYNGINIIRRSKLIRQSSGLTLLTLASLLALSTHTTFYYKESCPEPLQNTLVSNKKMFHYDNAMFALPDNLKVYKRRILEDYIPGTNIKKNR